MRLFQAADPHPGATEHIRRCLSHLNYDTPFIKRLISAAKATGYEVKFPVWSYNAWAHIGFPKLKIAIGLQSCLVPAWANNRRLEWKGRGWEFFAIDSRMISRVDQKKLVEDLKAAIEEVRKGRA